MEFTADQFSQMLYESNGLSKDDVKDAETVLGKADKRYLEALLNSSSKDFYQNLVYAVSHARMKMMGKLGEKKFIQRTNNVKEKFNTEGADVKKTSAVIGLIKAVAAKLLGLVTFAFDTAVILGGFAVRVVLRTGKVIVEETVGASLGIVSAFRKDVLGADILPKSEANSDGVVAQ